MNVILIEAGNERTPEAHFLKTILSNFFSNKEIRFIYMNGVDCLFTEPILNQIFQSQDEGENVLLIVDADTVQKGYGYKKRESLLLQGFHKHNLSLPFFIYPNNRSDGDVEVLMESIAQHKKYPNSHYHLRAAPIHLSFLP